MTRKANALTTARRLFRARRYTQTINFLEPQVFLFRQNGEYYYLLGMSCLYKGDYAGAASYLERANDIERNPRAVLGLAATSLRRRRTDKALEQYLEVLDLDPANRQATRALDWLRRVDPNEDIVDWYDQRIADFLPRRPIRVPAGVWIAAVAGTIALLVVFGSPTLVRVVERVSSTRFQRPGVELLDIRDEVVALDASAQDPRYQLSVAEAERLFREVGRLFNAGRDNRVRRELNRIALSNAGAALKTRAELVTDLLQEPDFTNFTDNYDLQTVRSELQLHAGVFVRWSGRATNVVVGEDTIGFDLLVGFVSGKILEGIVPVELDFAFLLEGNRSVEVIGAIAPDPTVDGGLRLRGSQIRLLAPGETPES